MKLARHILLVALAAVVGCKAKDSAPQTQPAPADAAPAVPAYATVSRAEFNTRALEHDLPLFWTEDADHDGVLDPDELAVLWGRGDTRESWVGASGFTPAFKAAYETLAKPFEPVDDRQKAVLADLQTGRPSVVASDLRAADPTTKAMLGHLLQAADVIEALYQKQVGVFGMEAQIAVDDTLSRSLFRLNHGPWCTAPGSGDDCNALASKPPRISGLYPIDMQAEKDFCTKIDALPEHDALMSPFTVVVRQGAKLGAVPYNVHFADDMSKIAEHLTAAADAIKDGSEQALETYLRAAAQAFKDNNWFAADEAWARMNAENSKWYLRIGPDETYFEPCNRKAGFHMTLARINPTSKTWQTRLTPVRGDMEKLAAHLAGPPYRAREVSFDMPDFIDIVINAGDDRAPRGATIGQSLPNFGPVGEGGRGRTVVMVNLYHDADNREATRRQASSLLCPATMKAFVDDPNAEVMTTVLHEATHNLGPAQGYKVRGKSTAVVFGGPTAAMLEELKAQTGGMIFTDWLVERGLVSAELATRAHVRDVLWMFGHISRGLTEPDGKPRPYSQLSAIQASWLIRDGVLNWREEAVAANERDTGCFELDTERFAASVRKLGKEVFGLIARGDAAKAKTLMSELVDDNAIFGEAMTRAGERWRREPQATFVYAVRVD